MIRLIVPALLAVAILILFPPVAPAQPAPGPRGSGPEMLLQRLDANQDGQISTDEIPSRAPDRLKAMLKRADANDDQKVSSDELAKVAAQFGPIGHRRGPGPFGPPASEPRRPGPPRASAAESGRPGPPRASAGEKQPPGRGGPAAGWQRKGPPQPPAAGRRRGGPPRGPASRPPRWSRPGGPTGVRPGPPDPQAIFKKLDKNNDQSLRLDEFTQGLNALRPLGPPPFRGYQRTPRVGPPFGPPMGRGPRIGILAPALFERADANQDGKVTLDEVRPEHREHFKRLLERADTDGDGALSREEAQRAVATMRARAARGRAGPRYPGFARYPMAPRGPAWPPHAFGRPSWAPTGAPPGARRAAPGARKPPAAGRPGRRGRAVGARKRSAEAERAEGRRRASETRRSPDAQGRTTGRDREPAQPDRDQDE
jgi:Ca2+-binding EF-hand superfamily protein